MDKFNIKKQTNYFLLILSILFISANGSPAQNSPCAFDQTTLQFKGSLKEQTKCLLRPVKPRGILGEQLRKLPSPLEKLIGKKVKIKKENFREYLRKNNVSELSLGGSLDEKLSTGKLPNGEKIQALYFLIHDVSAPNFLLKAFPENINDNTWKGNDLSQWLKLPVAHVFVNRVGESISVVEFG